MRIRWKLVKTIGTHRNFVEIVMPNTKMNHCDASSWKQTTREGSLGCVGSILGAFWRPLGNRFHWIQYKEQSFMPTMNNIESREKFLLPLTHQYINCILHWTKYALCAYCISYNVYILHYVYDTNGFWNLLKLMWMMMMKCNNI